MNTFSKFPALARSYLSGGRYSSARLLLAVMAVVFLGYLGVAEESSQISSSEQSLLLTIEDLKNPRALVIKLRREKDPLSAFIRNSFSSQTRQIINAYYETAVPDDALQQALIDDLNKLILGPMI